MKLHLLPKRKILAFTTIFGGDYLYHDGDPIVKMQIAEKFKFVERTPKYPPIYEDNERRAQFNSIKSVNNSINIVFGPDKIGKTVSLLQYAEEQRTKYRRKVLYLPIGKINSDASTKNTSLTSDLLREIGVPERRSLIGYLLQPFVVQYCKFRNIPYCADNRLDYALKMLCECMEEMFAEECKTANKRAPLMAVGTIKYEQQDDYDKCRPVVMVDEGHQNYNGTLHTPPDVDNTPYDSEKNELLHKIAKQLLRYHGVSKSKPFEMWISGHDNKLIEQCCIKYKVLNHPASVYNTIVLQDSLVQSSFDNDIVKQATPIGWYLNTPGTMNKIQTVFGNRVNDIVEVLLANNVSVSKVDDVLRHQVSEAKGTIQQLLLLCEQSGGVTAVNQLKNVMNRLAVPNTVNENGIRSEHSLSVDELPQCVRAVETFERVFFSVLGQVNFAKPLYKHVWREMNSKNNNSNISSNSNNSGSGRGNSKGWFW